MKQRLYIFITLCLSLMVISPLAEAQSKKNQPTNFTVYGNVKSAKGIPLMGVEITVQDSFINTTSDENGDFNITIPSIGSVLVFYTNYYKESFQTITSSDYLQIIMYEAEAGQGARDQVNMPYWTTQKRNVTASLNTITTDDFDKAKVTELGNALQGRVLGMTARLLAGNPGYEETTYLIRGNRTLNGNGTTNSLDLYCETDPLIIVDGFQRDFENLDPHEIESFSVLRDAAATSIYGNRGANGVILVNTKHGETNKRTIDFNYYEGVAQATLMPDYVDSYTYAQWYNEARLNDGLSPIYTESDLDHYKKGDSPLTHPNTNFYKEITNKFAPQRRASISMKGGNQVARYFVLFGYTYAESLFKTNLNPAYKTTYSFQRFNFRSNLDVNITKWLTLDVKFANRVQQYHVPAIATSDVMNAAHDPANSYPLSFTGIDPDLKKEIFMLGGDSVHQSNPLGQLNYGGFYERTRRYYQTSGHFRGDLGQFGLKGLSVEIGGYFDGYNYYNVEKTQVFRVWEYSQDLEGNPVYTSYKTPTSLTTSTSYDIQRYWGLDGKITYTNTWGDHAFTAMALYTQQRTELRQNNQPDRRFQNFAGWMNYSYKNRYFLDLTGSYAGTDKFFYTNHRREFYPSVGAGWIISSEPWMQNASWLNYLKMRASWGISGENEYMFVDINDNEERYPARERYWTHGSTQTRFGTAMTAFTTITEGRAPNSNIKIEKGSMFNWALELAAFRHRLNFEVDIWHEHRYDAYTASVGLYPKVHGALDTRMAITNDGIVDSQGIEVELSWADKVGNFSYALLGQFAYNDAVIKYAGEPYREYDNLWNTGNRPRMDYGYVCLGLFKDWEDIANSPQQMLGNYKPGDLKYADINNDGIINSNDLTAIGLGRDPRMQFNFAINLQYKNVSLDVLFQGTSAMTSYLNADANRAFYDNGTAQYWMANRFHYDENGNSNADTADYPIFTTVDSGNNWVCSSFWIKDATYLRVKNVELAFHLPSGWLKNMTLDKAKVYFSTYNPFTWSHLKAYNVDAEDWLAGQSRYFRTRTFNIGVDLTF